MATSVESLEGASLAPMLRRRHRKNRGMTWLLTALMAGIAGLLIWILTYVALKGVKAINWGFITDTPPGNPSDTGGGFANGIVGSLIIVGIATLVAVPFGIGCAIYLNQYAAGRISLKALLPDKPRGTLVDLGPLSVRLKAGQEPLAELSFGAAKTSIGLPGAGWHTFDLSWSNGKARLAIDGKAGADIAIGDLGLAPKGLVWGNYPQLVIGQRTGIAAIDEVRCSRGTP